MQLTWYFNVALKIRMPKSEDRAQQLLSRLKRINDEHDAKIQKINRQHKMMMWMIPIIIVLCAVASICGTYLQGKLWAMQTKTQQSWSWSYCNASPLLKFNWMTSAHQNTTISQPNSLETYSHQRTNLFAHAAERKPNKYPSRTYTILVTCYPGG